MKIFSLENAVNQLILTFLNEESCFYLNRYINNKNLYGYTLKVVWWSINLEKTHGTCLLKIYCMFGAKILQLCRIQRKTLQKTWKVIQLTFFIENHLSSGRDVSFVQWITIPAHFLRIILATFSNINYSFLINSDS